jgi:hypothetical protein
MTGEKDLFISLELHDIPKEIIFFGNNSKGDVTILGKIVSQMTPQFQMFIWLNLWGTICSPSHNFMKWATIDSY